MTDLETKVEALIAAWLPPRRVSERDLPDLQARIHRLLEEQVREEWEAIVRDIKALGFLRCHHSVAHDEMRCVACQVAAMQDACLDAIRSRGEGR